METELLKNPFQQVLAPELSHLQGAMFWGGKNAQVFKCLLPVIIAAFLTETLRRGAINLGVFDVGGTSTWCHRSGPFGSALELGVLFPSPTLFRKPICPNDD